MNIGPLPAPLPLDVFNYLHLYQGPLYLFSKVKISLSIRL